MVLLWRAILRQTYEVIRRDISPITIACSVLTEKDANQIVQTEQNEGHFQAADQLVNRLLELTDIEWTNSLPTALKKNHPVVFDAVTEARETIKVEWFPKMIESKWFKG